MKVEVLYVAECPGHPAAVEMVKDAMAENGLAAKIEEVLVTDEEMAAALRFRGSPTIRIDGDDVEASPAPERGFTLSCRWRAGAREAGLPSREMVVRAIVEAARRRLQ